MKKKTTSKTFKVLCISMYNDDNDRLEKMVKKLRASGVHRANKSALIRHALNQVDLSTYPKAP